MKKEQNFNKGKSLLLSIFMWFFLNTAMNIGGKELGLTPFKTGMYFSICVALLLVMLSIKRKDRTGFIFIPLVLFLPTIGMPILFYRNYKLQAQKKGLNIDVSRNGIFWFAVLIIAIWTIFSFVIMYKNLTI